MENLSLNEARLLHGLPTFKKRFTNEIPKLLSIYKNPRIEYFDNNIRLEIFYSGINILFIFKKYYPFKPPEVLLNNISYFKYLKCINKNPQCPCCISKLCSANWYPTFTLSLIINDIYKTIHLKQQKIRLLLIKIIKNKYLNQDIPLELWI